MFYEIAKLFAENCEKWMNSIRNILSPTSSAQNTLPFVLRNQKKCSFSTKDPTFCSNEPENSLLRINGL
jgi:hypothetical protein